MSVRLASSSNSESISTARESRRVANDNPDPSSERTLDNFCQANFGAGRMNFKKLGAGQCYASVAVVNDYSAGYEVIGICRAFPGDVGILGPDHRHKSLCEANFLNSHKIVRTSTASSQASNLSK
jgi:hypothetical protein